MSQSYDLCVIGAGPAGFAAAIRAFDVGKSVALVEAGRVGGTGLHEGALSSKTMWHLSNDYARTRREGRGFRANNVALSYESVTASVGQAVSERRELLVEQLRRIEADGDRPGSIELVRGHARFISPHEVEITLKETRRSLRADFFLVATGSTPRSLEGVEIDGKTVVTSDHVESWNRFPESMVIVGSGVVGCEYATIFGHYDRTKIYMIDRRDRILPFEDADVADCVARNFERMGVTIHKRARLTKLEVIDGRVRYVVDCDGKEETVEVEKALISIGRRPRVADLGLEAAGVSLDERGGISAPGVQTNVPHIFGAGDCTMDIALANVAEMEGRSAVETMFGLAPPPIQYNTLSTIMFLEPEVASVGVGEQEARKRGLAYRAAKVSNRLIARNVAMRNTEGFIKLLAAPDNSILGLRVVGPQASSCIQGIALLIELGAQLEHIDRCVHPHPAVTEGVQECARLLLGRSLLKPDYVDGVSVVEYSPPN